MAACSLSVVALYRSTVGQLREQHQRIRLAFLRGTSLYSVLAVLLVPVVSEHVVKIVVVKGR